MNQRPTRDAQSQMPTIGDSYRMALELINAGRLEEALLVCRRILAARPQQPDVHKLLAAIAYQKRDGATAIKHFQRALKLGPNDADTQLNLARTYRDFGMWPEAAKAFEIAVKRSPTDSSNLYDLGKAYSNLDRHAEAIPYFQKALPGTDAPDIVQTALATAFLKCGQLEEAEAHYRSVLARTAGFIPALVNLAILRDIQGRMDDVLPILDTAISHAPDSVDVHYHRALALITRERLKEGWNEYIWRYKQPGATTLHDLFKAPYWSGEPLQDRHILIWTEQGLGDEILLTSMIPDVIARGARCTLVCTERLAPVFQNAFPAIKVLTRENMKKDAAPAMGADFQASLSQLGLHLRPTISSFPQGRRYLTTNPAEVSEFRTRYQQGSSDRLVGIAWHSANRDAGSEKSTSLTAWQEILRTPGYRFVSLQYGDHAAAYRELKNATGLSMIVDRTVDAKRDLARFATQVAAMDLVISVSNTTVHFAGALNIPVWTLVPSSVGRIWYWFLNRTDSPWYPSMRLFRQGHGASWEPTLHSIAQELKRWP
jgi:tetratricopeptide (TPR) repeat protein/ADP-heptose:LPS heptosyltransferase